ncbi:MAG: hypothetical protein ABI091_28705 [Ferruginibacter sp.]
MVLSNILLLNGYPEIIGVNRIAVAGRETRPTTNLPIGRQVAGNNDD